MKCPKCGYIGFEHAEKCRNCGYDFSLLTEPAIDLDLPIKGDEPVAPPADFDFRTGDTPPPMRPVPQHNTDFDLPAAPRPPSRDLPLFQSPTTAPTAPGAAVPPKPFAPPAAAPAPTVPAAQPRGNVAGAAPSVATRPPAPPASPLPAPPRGSGPVVSPGARTDAVPAPGAANSPVAPRIPAPASPTARTTAPSSPAPSAPAPSPRPGGAPAPAVARTGAAASVPPIVVPPSATAASVPSAARTEPAPSAPTSSTPAPARDVPPSRRAVPTPRPSRPAPVAFDFREADLPEPDAAEHQAVARPTTARGTRNAGSVARAVAAILDALILLGLDAAVLYFTLRVCRLSFSDVTILPLAPLIAFFILVDGGYLVAFTTVGGQTIGKMATSLKVVSEEGDRVMPGQAAVRALAYLLSALLAGVGFVPGLFGPTRRALHDRLAKTRVVRV